MPGDLKKAYHTILDEHFPPRLEVSFIDGDERTTLSYEKVLWEVEGERKGLRYGENPGQEAAFYRLVGGNLAIGGMEIIRPGQWLVSDAELLQFGKHPGKTNLTDADNALNILRYLMDKPCVTIMKHNNPCGVAMADTLADAYVRADMADRVAAFGGCIACNRPIDRATAEQIAERYAEVVVAPDFEAGAVEVLAGRKNLRIMRIPRMDRLAEFAAYKTVDFKSLIDGGLVAQTSFTPTHRSKAGLPLAETDYKDKHYKVDRAPTEREWADLVFGWLVEAGVTSNSVLYVKDLTTVGIGTGEQDRVGVAEIARDKAYRKLADRICFEHYKMPFNDLKDAGKRAEIEAEVREKRGGLIGAAMVSDAFFPFRDGIEVGLREGVTAVIQPGGSQNDYQSIEACNEVGATMVFTGQRSFKH
ncbi:MAG: IMP cyclohydrolase [Myxococcales bacterium]|nr:MAG: IMP cyclohydrolase [Myxococcales bacterium]